MRLATTFGLASGSAPDWADAGSEARPAETRARKGTRSRFMPTTYTPGNRCKKAHPAQLAGANPLQSGQTGNGKRHSADHGPKVRSTARELNARCIAAS